MRKAQFFITTIVLVSLTIILTVMNLYIPSEINANNLAKSEQITSNLEFTKETLNELMNYFRINWLSPYTHRTVISSKTNFALNDASVNSVINLPDNTYVSSLIMTDEYGSTIPFGIDWTDNARKEGNIYFQTSSEALKTKKYYLYYNTAPGEVIINEKESLIIYGQDTESFWVKTGSYYALINKSQGGSIKQINISGSPNAIIDVDNILKCSGNEYSLTNSLNTQVTLSANEYFIKAVFTGTRFTNETYEITELFLPDEIRIIDEMTMAGDSPCTYWASRISANRTTLMNYMDSNKLNFEPTPAPAIAYAGMAYWFEVYGNGNSMSFSTDALTQLYINATTTQNNAELHYINTTSIIDNGIYNKELRITPLSNARFNATKKYAKPSTSTVNEDFETEFNNLLNAFKKYFSDFNAVVNIELKNVGLTHEEKSESTEWHGTNGLRDYFSVSGPDVIYPIEAILRLERATDLNSISLYSKTELPYQVSTSNYARGGSSINELNNSNTNNNLLLFNPDGKEFEITLSANSTGYINYPNDVYYNGLDNNHLIGYWKFENNALDETGINPGNISNSSLHYYNDVSGFLGLDEGTGTLAYDLTDNNNDGTITGATWTSGNYGSALSFDGINDYMDLFTFNYQTFSISMWVNPGSIQKIYADILDADHYIAGPDKNFVLQQEMSTTNRYGFGVSDGSCTQFIPCPGFNLNADTWQHLVVTRDGSSRTNKIYVNGILVNSSLGTGDINYVNPFLRIGNLKGGTLDRQWNGTMDELSIYTRTLNSTEILELYNSTRSEYNYGSGKYGMGVELSGKTSDYLTADINLNGVTNFTVLGWWKPKNYFSEGSFSGALVLSTSPDSYAFGLTPEYGDICFTVRGADNNLNYSCAGANAFLLQQNNWHFLAGVREGDSLKLYIDGVLNNTITDPNVVRSLTTTQIGIGQGGVRKFKGTIDEVQVYDRALNSSEINDLYTASSPYYKIPSKVSFNADSLVGYWNFDTESNNTIDLAYANDGTLYGDTLGLWHFNEASGTYTKDETTNNNYGTLSGSTPRTTGVYGNALNLGGSRTVNLGRKTSLYPGIGSFSVTAWALHVNYSYPMSTIPFGVSNAYQDTKKGWQIGHGYSTNSLGIAINDGTNKVYTNLVLDTGYQPSELINQWTFFSFVFDRLNGRLYAYINGVKQSNYLDISSVTGDILSTEQDVLLGYIQGWYLNGTVDEVAIYNKSLSDTEVLDLYNARKAKFIEYKPGKWGTGITFDGINDYVNVSNDDTLSPTGSWSSSAWVYWKNYADTRLLCKNYQPNYLYTTAEGSLRALSANGAYAVSNELLPLNEWMHLVSIYDSSTNRIKLYKNGNEMTLFTDTTGAGAPTINTNPLRMGMEDIGLSSFNGSIDDVRIYNRSLSINEVRTLYASSPYYKRNPDNLVGYWRLDEGTGSTGRDYAGNNDVTRTGGTWTAGRYYNAVNFDGSTVLTASTIKDLDLTANLTLSAWIYALDRDYATKYVGLMAPIVSKIGGGYSTANYALLLNNPTQVTFVHRNTGDLQYDNFDLPISVLNSWHHVVASVKNNIVSLYLDGNLTGTASAAEDGGVMPTNTFPQYIEIGGLAGYGFNGTIDEVRIYNNSLSAKEVKELYESSPYKNTLVLSNTDQSGFYSLNLTQGDSVNVTTTLPKMIAVMPAVFNSKNPVYLLINENMTRLDLNITKYTSNTQKFTIYNSLNESIESITNGSPGTLRITKTIIPCVNDCIYRLEVNNSGTFMINSASIKYASSSKEYMINPDMPEIVIINVNTPGGEKEYHAYYNNNTFQATREYTSDLTYSLTDKTVNNSFYSFDLDDLKFIYKGTDLFNAKGWTSCSNTCVNSFSEVKFIETGSERVVAWLNTTVGIEYYMHFYPNTTYFKVITKTSGVHSFGPSWAVNNSGDIYYNYRGGSQALIGAGNKYISKSSINGPIGYVTKSNELNSMSVLFDTNKLEQNNSIKVNSTALIIKAAFSGTYEFVLNTDPELYIKPLLARQEGITITFNYSTNQLSINGQLTN